MNTFPAFYPNAGQPMQQATMPMMNNMQQPQQYPTYNQQMYSQQIQAPPTPTVPNLIGKFVENKDIVGITEIPVGAYGFFPKADLKEIYIKMWNKEGTTDIITYQPVEPLNPVNQESSVNDVTAMCMSQILQKITALESKIDALNQQSTTLSVEGTKPNTTDVLSNL